jgi:diphosphomevalonate decarboxylase
MGKTDSSRNLPANASLSITLSGLKTITELREVPGAFGTRSPLRVSETAPEGIAPELLFRFKPDVARLQNHFERVRERTPDIFRKYSINLGEPTNHVELRTANTFPASSGIASSASGFAALTLATAALMADNPADLQRAYVISPDLRAALASLSREGSGSSCRSFEGPFVAWEGDRARKVPSDAVPRLAHFVLMVSSGAKAIPSSEAHTRVQSSPLWEGRVQRANERFVQLLAAIGRGDLKLIASLAFREAWEMHSLFHTSNPPFSYFEPGTLGVLNFLAPFVEGEKPPIVTLDAGPNVHLFVAYDDKADWRARLAGAFPGGHAVKVLEDEPGTGAEVIV